MLADEEWEERWRKTEEHYSRQAEDDRQYHIEVVQRALLLKTGFNILGSQVAAEVAIDALIEDGVVFARMGKCE